MIAKLSNLFDKVMNTVIGWIAVFTLGVILFELLKSITSANNTISVIMGIYLLVGFVGVLFSNRIGEEGF